MLLFALLSERTVEVLLAIWHPEEANNNEAEVKIQAGTQRWALPSNCVLGLLMASFRVRVIDQFFQRLAAL